MKSLYTALVITLCINTTSGQSLWDTIEVCDYHVHMFSPDMFQNITDQGYDMEQGGFEIIHKDASDYGDIDVIMERNSDAKMVLISAGYAYKDQDTTDNITEYDWVRKENDYLASLVEKYPERLLGFVGIDPLEEFSIPELLVNDLIRQARKQQQQLEFLRTRLENAEQGGFTSDSKQQILAASKKQLNG